MKRRKFLTNSAVLGTAIPLGVATPAILTSCSGNAKRTSVKTYSAEELGMFSFVDIAPEGKPVKNPYVQEHIHLVESIRLNKKVNQAEDLAYSTQVAIMGREAAYTGQAITWDEIMASNLRYGPETYAMGPLPDYHERVVPVPGKDPSSPM